MISRRFLTSSNAAFLCPQKVTYGTEKFSVAAIQIGISKPEVTLSPSSQTQLTSQQYGKNIVNNYLLPFHYFLPCVVKRVAATL